MRKPTFRSESHEHPTWPRWSPSALGGGRGTRPLRVLVMISSMDGGGSERQALLLLRHLDRQRFAPELYLLRRSGSLLSQVPADVPIHAFEDAESVTMTWKDRLGLPGGVHRRQVADVARILSQRQIDVVYDRTFHMTLIAGEAATLANVPRVSTIVSPPSRAVPLNAGRFLAIKRRRLRTAYQASAAVLAVSHPTASDAATFYRLPRNRFAVVANPVDSDALDQAVMEMPVPRRDQRYTIACVGRISVEKGQMELIQALKLLRDNPDGQPLPRVWMIGDGPLRGSLQQAASELGLTDYVDFLGHLAAPAPWIAAADAVCIPSHFEGFPNVMLEAMALGVPVIARSLDVVRSLGRLATNPEVRGRTYVTSFSSTPATTGYDLARKIVRTRTNITATRSKVAAARRLAREELSMASTMSRVEQILAKAVSGRLAD